MVATVDENANVTFGSLSSMAGAVSMVGRSNRSNGTVSRRPAPTVSSPSCLWLWSSATSMARSPASRVSMAIAVTAAKPSEYLDATASSLTRRTSIQSGPAVLLVPA